MMQMNPETRVGTIATEFPLATRVFARHGIDYCCGGGKPVAEVCKQKGLDPEALLAEIVLELGPGDSTPIRWDHEPLDALLDHILTTYHRPLDEELPRLEAMARKVDAVHRDKMPEVLPTLLAVYLELKAELDQHMAKEEQILFPMIRRGQGPLAVGPVSVMEQEHEDAGAALQRIRELTNDYTVPEEACTTWRALWHGLAALETALHEHIHLENNILFPRALAG